MDFVLSSLVYAAAHVVHSPELTHVGAAMSACDPVLAAALGAATLGTAAVAKLVTRKRKIVARSEDESPTKKMHLEVAAEEEEEESAQEEESTDEEEEESAPVDRKLSFNAGEEEEQEHTPMDKTALLQKEIEKLKSQLATANEKVACAQLERNHLVESHKQCTTILKNGNDLQSEIARLQARNKQLLHEAQNQRNEIQSQQEEIQNQQEEIQNQLEDNKHLQNKIQSQQEEIQSQLEDIKRLKDDNTKLKNVTPPRTPVAATATTTNTSSVASASSAASLRQATPSNNTTDTIVILESDDDEENESDSY